MSLPKESSTERLNGSDWPTDNSVCVISAIVLTSEEKNLITSRISHVAGKKMGNIKYEVNPEIIGGAIIQVGDMIFDGSIRKSLEPLREELILAEAK